MRGRVLGSTTAFVLTVMVFSSVALVQAGQRGVDQSTGVATSTPHDPRDMSGVWLSRGGGPGNIGIDPAVADERGFRRDGGLLTEWGSSSPLTPAGLAAVEANISGKGPRRVPPVYANDPLGDANPPGLLRALVYGRPFQLIHLPDKVLQIFEWTRVWREVWTDREMPEDIEPFWGRWYGYSVGKWEDDAFVVETVGLDARAWLDMWGTPFSESLRLEERWRRLDRDTLELTLRIDDPETYTEPWVTDPRVFRLQPKDSPNGELLEVIFAPMDEREFNERIRDPAGRP